MGLSKKLFLFTIVAAFSLVSISAYSLNNNKLLANNRCDELESSSEIQKCLIEQAAVVEGSRCTLRTSFLGVPSWHKYLPKKYSSGKCTPTIENTRDALPIGVAILEMMLRIAGIVAVVMVFIGAFRFVTSTGNGEAAAGARKTVINALIGLVIVVISTGVVNYLGGTLAT